MQALVYQVEAVQLLARHFMAEIANECSPEIVKI
jgi:hypothetical protein